MVLLDSPGQGERIEKGAALIVPLGRLRRSDLPGRFKSRWGGHQVGIAQATWRSAGVPCPRCLLPPLSHEPQLTGLRIMPRPRGSEVWRGALGRFHRRAEKFQKIQKI